jgi:menaquinone-specific isochorismate synthase
MWESRIDLPDQDRWKQNVLTALEEISAGRLHKVVLARKTILRFPFLVDPHAVFTKLRSCASPTTTPFYLPLSEKRIFLGATPEILFSRKGRLLSTMALAGSSTDEQFTEQAHLEIAWTVQGMQEALLPLTEQLEIGEIDLLHSTGINHLHCTIQGVLKAEVSDRDLLDALHPTPSIAGFPRKAALEFLAQYEPFERGPYAAPLGFSSTNESHFLIGIRSAIIEENQITLFAGAGIVLGADPTREWQELEAKIAPFLHLLSQQ